MCPIPAADARDQNQTPTSFISTKVWARCGHKLNLQYREPKVNTAQVKQSNSSVLLSFSFSTAHSSFSTASVHIFISDREMVNEDNDAGCEGANVVVAGGPQDPLPF